MSLKDRTFRTAPRQAGLPSSTGRIARRLGLRVGSALSLRGRCDEAGDALPPVRFIVGGIADFPFDSISAATVAGTLIDVDKLCGGEGGDRAEMLLVRSRRRPEPSRPPQRSTQRHPESLRRDQRRARRAIQPGRVFVFSSDLRRPGDGDSVLRFSPDRRPVDGLGESSARGDCRPARDRVIAVAGGGRSHLGVEHAGWDRRTARGAGWRRALGVARRDSAHVAGDPGASALLRI